MHAFIYECFKKYRVGLAICKASNVYGKYICISYNIGKSALPDIYARRPRASAYISGKA